jgi:hypothetical protein
MILKKIAKHIWNIFSSFVGAPYEQQAKNLDLDKVDPTLRGPENPKSDRKVYRANKVSSEK